MIRISKENVGRSCSQSDEAPVPNEERETCCEGDECAYEPDWDDQVRRPDTQVCVRGPPVVSVQMKHWLLLQKN